MRSIKYKKVCAIVLALIMAVPATLSLRPVHAAELRNRSLAIQTSLPNVTTTHTFSFLIGTTSPVGSISFEYCNNSPLPEVPCNAPPGFSALLATLANESGVTGFSIHPNSTSNKIILTRAPIIAPQVQATYQFDNIQNPSTVNQTVFARIATYASNDGTGATTDVGSVAMAITTSLDTTLFVPPYIIFCVGVSVAPDCSSASGYSIDLGELSTSATKFATSQFAAATNDPAGYVLNMFGTTMTSGNNVLNAPGVPTPSQTGTSQYGMNLRANASPGVGQNPLGAGSATPAADYNIPNQFVFRQGVIADSSLPTDFNTFTASYIVNVPNGQAPGIYSTTVTYIATAQF